MRKIYVAIVRLMAPDDASEIMDKAARDDFRGHLNDIEGQLSMETPEGYYVKIEDA